MISKTGRPVCQSGGEIITAGTWVVRPVFVGTGIQKVIVCVDCDLGHPLNDLGWYDRRQEENRSCGERKQ